MDNLTPRQLLELFEEADRSNNIQQMEEIVDFICDNHVDDNGKMCVRTENPDNNGMLWALNTLCTILINKQRELAND